MNPGQVINLSTTINVSTSNSTGPFDQTVQGVFVSDVLLQGTLKFEARSVTVPSDASGVLETPFTMNGEISFFQLEPFHPPGPLLFTAAFRGSGMASMGLFPTDGGFFAVSGTSFSFKPAATVTPEPGTLALVGGGVALFAERHRRRRS